MKEEVKYAKYAKEFIHKINESSDDLQNIFTPLELCREMLDKIKNKDGKILILFNLELLLVLRKTDVSLDDIYYASPCETKRNFAEKFGLNRNNISNIEYNTKEINLGIKEDMKFDAIVANPPYNNSMDLKFLDKSIDLMSDKGEIVFVHPSTWLIDEKMLSKKFNDIRTNVEPYLDSVKIFNANKLFGVALSVPCIISHFRKENIYSVIKVEDEINNVKIEYDNIWQINKFSNNKEYFSIKEKIKKKKNDYVENYRYYTKKNKEYLSINEKSKNKKYKITEDCNNYYVNMASVRGNVNVRGSGNEILKDDFYTILINKEKVYNIKTKPNYFIFNTEIEANNFISYIKSNFARFCLAILKNNSNLHRKELSLIPYLDFTQEWTDEKLYKHFNITKEEQEFINQHIPEYY